MSQVLKSAGGRVSSGPDTHTGSTATRQTSSGEPAAPVFNPIRLTNELFDVVALLRLSLDRVDFLEHSSTCPDNEKALHELQRVLRMACAMSEGAAEALFAIPSRSEVRHD